MSYIDKEFPIRFVMVETTDPGNIGAAARALKTMGLSHLYLIKPRSFPNPKAVARASGALDVLENAVVCNDLDEAIGDCRLVLAASARSRRIPWDVITPEVAAQQLLSVARQGPVAIMFGRERYGLLNEELHRAHAHVAIPSNPDYGVLNVASAMQVIAYEISKHANQFPLIDSQELPATKADIERLYEHMTEVLTTIDFFQPKNPRQLLTRLKRLFQRARLEAMEVRILRGILTQILRLSQHHRQ